MMKKIFFGMLMATALFSLVNCAKGGGGSSKSVATTSNCSVGQVYSSSHGRCLPTAQCVSMGYGANYGYYNGQCYPGSISGMSCQGSCGSGYVQTMYGCMRAATTAQCGSNYTCAGYGAVNGGASQCVPGIDNGTYYGNNYQQQYYQQYPQYYQQYPQQYYYNPYMYNNGGLYFYWGF